MTGKPVTLVNRGMMASPISGCKVQILPLTGFIRIRCSYLSLQLAGPIMFYRAGLVALIFTLITLPVSAVPIPISTPASLSESSTLSSGSNRSGRIQATIPLNRLSATARAHTDNVRYCHSSYSVPTSLSSCCRKLQLMVRIN